MDSGSFRLGNWVRVHGLGVPKGIGQVTGIGAEACYINIGAAVYQYSAHEIHGIELSEEILLKCGFELKNPNANAYQHRDKSRYGYFKHGAFSFAPLSTSVNTVHDLENLFFAIYREELQISL